MAVSDKNTCAFYASDYHLEMIMLPYINENLKKDKNIYIFTQNNLETTINTLIEKVNLKEDEKNNILNINWKNEDENKYNKIIEDNKEKIIFVKGNNNYIKEVNNKLEEIEKSKEANIVDCYHLDEVAQNKEKILKNYKQILVTKGIERI